MNSSTDRLVRATTRAALVAGLLLGAPAGVFGQSVNLNQLTLEDLLQVEVSSVSRKSQPVGRTAAAIHVITREDIRRSGAQTIPDLLRMVPGFNIAQVDGGTWAISARGVPEVYSNKLLVLVDGRSVYTPFFGGVNWDMQNLPLDEIERIEVIRGPGGSVWGANATNGVVNILTRSAENTHGGLASVELGGRLLADTHARYGGSFGPGVHYRAYARRVARGRDVELAGIQVSDPAESFVAGSRLDFARGQNRFTLHASAQTGRSERVRRNFQLTTLTSRYAPELTTFHGGNIVLGWTHTSGPESDSGVQVYYDHQQRSSSIVDSWHTLDVDARHRRKLGGRHEVVVGAGYRYWFNDVTNGVFRVVPASERMGTLSAFAQDEIELVKNRLRATAGVKLERSRFTGAGFQPTARLTWTLHESHAFWGAASRAVRTPTRVDRGMFVPVGAGRGPAGRPLVVTLEGNPEFQPEILRAAEGGYRFNRGTVSLDAVAFDNYYDDLAGIETGSLTRSDDPPNSWRLPLMFTNSVAARSSGFEVSGTWRVVYRWKVMAAYSRMAFEATGVTGAGASSRDPIRGDQHQIHIRNYVDLPGGLEVSVLGYRVTTLAAGVPGFTRADLRLGWLRGPLELSTGVQNLGHGRREFVDATGIQSIELAPMGFVRIAVRF